MSGFSGWAVVHSPRPMLRLFQGKVCINEIERDTFPEIMAAALNCLRAGVNYSIGNVVVKHAEIPELLLQLAKGVRS